MNDPSSRHFNLVVRGPDDVANLLHACGVPSDEPAQIVLALAVTEGEPCAHTVCGAALRSGDVARQGIDADQLVGLAGELVVGAVVLATVETGGARPPTRRDVRRFVALRRACAEEGVALLDWVVLAGLHWWSMRERVINEVA